MTDSFNSRSIPAKTVSKVSKVSKAAKLAEVAKAVKAQEAKATPNKLRSTKPKAKVEATPNAGTPAKGRKARDARYREVHKAERSDYMRGHMQKVRAKPKSEAMGREAGAS